MRDALKKEMRYKQDVHISLREYGIHLHTLKQIERVSFSIDFVKSLGNLARS